MYPKPNNGFTLLEITVVLAIIALIVGGILVGKDLYNAARNRGIIKELNTYQRATQLFKAKYEYYPGDMPNDDRYWPQDDENPQGNGNGIILWYDEGPTFWYHLRKAKLIEKQLDYSDDSWIGSNAVPGVIVPESEIVKEAGWTPHISKYMRKNALMFGKGASSWSSTPYADCAGFCLANFGAISTRDTFYIDSKLDDGDPQLGNVRVSFGAGQPYYSPFAGCVQADSTSQSGYSYVRSNHNNESRITGCNFYAALEF